MGSSSARLIVLLIIINFISEGWSEVKCNCSKQLLDCSNLKKTSLLRSDICSKEFDNVNLHGNNIRSLSVFADTKGYYKTFTVSRNELGFGDWSLAQIIQTNELDISYNYLKSLDLYSTCASSKLDASNNDLVEFVRKSSCVPTVILLSNNKFTSLDEITKFFPADYYGRVNTLDVSRNPIVNVSKDSLDGLLGLENIYLNDTYLLSSLPEDIFSKHYRLRNLHLGGNALRSLPANIFQSQGQLEYLDLQRNAMQFLPDGIFANLTSLNTLVLDDNSLQELQGSMFSRLHSLEQLSARNNYLKSLPSMTLCLGPLVSAVFNGNQVNHIGENEVRSYMRLGFQLGDLIDNPVDNSSLQWAFDATDMNVTWEKSLQNNKQCGEIQLIVKDHGSFLFCV